MFSEIARSSFDHTFRTKTWTTPLTILLSWFSEDVDLLLELNVSQEFLTEAEYYSFISTVLFSQQVSVASKKEKLSSILEKEDFANQVHWLKRISILHPSIAQPLAVNIISSYQGYPNAEDQTTNGAYNLFLQDLARQSKSTDPLVSEVFDPDFTSLDQWITLFGIANDEAQYNALLEYKNELLKGIQIGIEAHNLRKNIGGLSADEILTYWAALSKQAPQSDIAKAEYALALIDDNNYEDLKNIEWGSSDDPLVLLTRALVDSRTNNEEVAQVLAEKAVDKCVHFPIASLKEIDRYLQILTKLNSLHLSEKLLVGLLTKFASKSELYRLLAQVNIQMDHSEEAINHAKVALALYPGDYISRRNLAKLYDLSGESDKALREWEILFDTKYEIDPLTTEDRISYANCALATNQPERAISICEKSLETEPANGEISYTLGEAYYQMGLSDKAAEYYHKAVTLSPSNDLPWIKLVDFRLAAGQNEATLDLLSTAINACPNSSELSSKLADYYIEEGSYAESIPYLNKAYALDPNNQIFALKLGSTLHILGQPEEAICIFKDALLNSPDNIDIQRAYVNSLISSGRGDEAIEPLMKILEKEPEDLAPYLDLATIILSQKDSNVARIDVELTTELLERGLKIDPENITGRLLYADLLAANNRDEEAKDIYVSLSENSDLPDNIRWKVNYGLGLMSTKLGQMDVALAALEEAGIQNPSNFEIHQKLAETYASANLPKAAIDSAQSALSIAPHNAENLIWYSEFCNKLGDMPEALSSLDAAIKQQPDKAELRLKLGELQLKMKDNEAAKKTFQELIAHGKLNTKLIRKLAKTLSQSGEIDEAIYYLEFGIEQDPVSSLPLLLDLVEYEEKNGNYSNAVASIEKAIAINPENIELQIIKADLLAHAHEYEQSIIVLQDAKHQIHKGLANFFRKRFRANIIATNLS